MTIKQVTKQTVISTLGQGKIVVAVDFNAGQYIDLRQKTIEQIWKLMERENVMFWSIEYSE